MAEEKQVLCPKCRTPAKFLELGSATGRPYYRCTGVDCGYTWPGSNPAAAAAGALGGKARAAALPEEELSKQASNAARARWNAAKQKGNEEDLKRATGQVTSKKP